jgi:hypothetical protein
MYIDSQYYKITGALNNETMKVLIESRVNK